MKVRLSTKVISVCLALSLVWLSFPSSFVLATSSATATAQVVMTVLPRIQVSRQQDIRFGTSTPGDAALTISPSDTVRAATFLIRGEPGHAYSVALPPIGKVFMTTEKAETVDQAIGVSKFQSSASHPTFGGDGTHTLYVGATRDAIRTSQSQGEYSGSFTITITYE